jgi:hypothetical protein
LSPKVRYSLVMAPTIIPTGYPDADSTLGASSFREVKPDPMAWMSTIGMFSGDELMKEIDEEGALWRREQTELELAEM